MDFGISCGGVGMGEAARPVRVQFTTKLGPPLRVPSASLAVPSNLTRMGLSEIVNILLKNCKSPTFLSKLDWSIDPLMRACYRACRRADHEAQLFDFLVDGALIRLPLEEFLLAKGISAEKVLEIEYIKAVAPRKQQDPCLHDDGGSDPILRIWNPCKPGTLAPIFQFSSHSSWIVACKWHQKS